MTEITKNQPVPNEAEGEEKLKALEGDIKNAFKEGRFDQVINISNDIKAIDPENRLASRLVEKMEKTKADMLKKENASKIKEYDAMICRQIKEGSLENARKLAEELKELDPILSAKWNEKAQMAEAEMKKKQNVDKIKDLEQQLKTAFSEKHFEEVEKISEQLKEFDPENKTSLKFLSKIEKEKADAKRKQNADKINILQDQIKSAFEEGRFDEMGKTANQLFEIDPKNSFANKYLQKAVKAKEEAEKMKAKETVKESGLKEVISAKEKPVSDKNEPEPEKKEGIFSKIFKKSEKNKEEAGEDQAVKQDVAHKAEITASIPAVSVPAVKTEEAPKLKLETSAVSEVESAKAETPDTAESDSGNVFTRMFGKKEEDEKPSQSIIDTIVAKTAERKFGEKEKKPKKEKEDGVALAKFSRLLLQFSLAFIVISAGFFYVQNIDINNTVLGFLGVEDNYASSLHKAADTLVEKENEEQALNKEIDKYKAGYDNKHEKVIEGIIEKRLNWPDVLAKINEVANSIYERNEISQYITFNSFSFDASKGQIRVSGSLSDPLGKNLTKLVEIEEAFRNFPKDPNDPEDKTKPYFYDFQEFSSLSKSYDSNTGKYKSSLSLSFSLNP